MQYSFGIDNCNVVLNAANLLIYIDPQGYKRKHELPTSLIHEMYDESNPISMYYSERSEVVKYADMAYKSRWSKETIKRMPLYKYDVVDIIAEMKQLVSDRICRLSDMHIALTTDAVAEYNNGYDADHKMNDSVFIMCTDKNPKRETISGLRELEADMNIAHVGCVIVTEDKSLTGIFDTEVLRHGSWATNIHTEINTPNGAFEIY